MDMPKSVSYETVGVSYDTVGVSNETVGTIMRQGDYSEKSHKKCPEEHRACGDVVIVAALNTGLGSKP